jgi:CRISPR-associated endonuclease/helicase Cas3
MELDRLEGISVVGEGLRDRPVPVAEPPVRVLRRPDLIALFDTAPDLSGADVDVAPFAQDGINGLGLQ